MERAFRDNRLKQRILDEGYAVLPFLNLAEIEGLKQVFSDLHPDPLPSFYVSSSPATNRQRRQAMGDAVRHVVEPKLAAMFKECKLLGGFFFAKEPGSPDSKIEMHVDPSFVDERQFKAMVFWCPLVDVHRENGCLEVVAGSQQLVGPLRPYGDSSGSHPFRNVRLLLNKEYTRVVEMAAGEAIFYDSRLLHGSGPNLSGARRVAVGGGLAPRDAPFRYSVVVSPGKAEVFEVGPEFYWSYRAGERPPGVKSLGTVEHQVEQLSVADVSAAPSLRSESREGRG